MINTQQSIYLPEIYHLMREVKRVNVEKIDSKQLVEIIIKSTKTNCNGLKIFLAFVQEGDIIQMIGQIHLYVLKKQSDGEYGAQIFPFMGTIDPLKGIVQRIHKRVLLIATIIVNGNKDYRGIGTCLMQLGMEYGVKHGCKGRVELKTLGSPHAFYYKLGFRSSMQTHEQDDAFIKQEIEAAKRDKRTPCTSALSGIVMHLSAPNHS